MLRTRQHIQNVWCKRRLQSGLLVFRREAGKRVQRETFADIMQRRKVGVIEKGD